MSLPNLANTLAQAARDIALKDARIAELEADVTRLETELWRQGNKLAEAQADGERLLVLATKWCDSDHHDWKEILKFGGKK